MRVVALTGSASGIGGAVKRRLEGEGAQVIGVDLRDAEVIADLATREGRARACDEVAQRAGGALDGLVACAGLGPQVQPTSLLVSVNYFGATGVLDGLRPLLAAGRAPAAVAISSNSATISPGSDGEIAAACLAGDEEAACRLALASDGGTAYAAGKLALARYVRRNAPGPAWAGSGIRLNAVAPGAVRTPLLQAGLDDPVFGPAIRGFPIPLGGFGSPEHVASAVAFLLGEEGAFCCGSVLYVDGGSDALLRGDAY